MRSALVRWPAGHVGRVVVHIAEQILQGGRRVAVGTQQLVQVIEEIHTVIYGAIVFLLEKLADIAVTAQVVVLVE
jgi:hypothetical protein